MHLPKDTSGATVVFEKLYRLQKTAGFDLKTTEAQHYRRYLLQQRVLAESWNSGVESAATKYGLDRSRASWQGDYGDTNDVIRLCNGGLKKSLAGRLRKHSDILWISLSPRSTATRSTRAIPG